ncbi:hypothetical protein [Methanoculleus sp. 10]|uniref:hypothetical protein n=1 Tax=Methanoculleus sp. 10 TaxID=430615 RepID=UPI0025E65849|nr:hypothetical protein [Methanoculleus sp. 10]
MSARDGLVDLLSGSGPHQSSLGEQAGTSGEAVFEAARGVSRVVRMERVLLETRRCMRTMRKPM